MVENSKFYTIEEVEQLKLRILAYKNLLTTFKNGTSMQDFLEIKDEFEELKKRISEIDSLGDVLGEGQLSETSGNDKQVKQFMVQLTSLNQNVEEFLSVVNKLMTEIPLLKTNAADKLVSNTDSPQQTVKQRMPETKQKQLSYYQLKDLASQVSQLKPIEENKETEINDYILNKKSHFNSAYFQSINTRSNITQNNLNRSNSLKTNPLEQIRNEKSNQTEESNKVNKQGPINPFSPRKSSIFESNIPTQTFFNKRETPAENVIQESIPLEEKLPETHPQIIIPIEEEHVTDVENKKHKTSLFFNLFRK